MPRGQGMISAQEEFKPAVVVHGLTGSSLLFARRRFARVQCSWSQRCSFHLARRLGIFFYFTHACSHASWNLDRGRNLSDFNSEILGKIGCDAAEINPDQPRTVLRRQLATD